jgi:L-ribulose-5-phosphate 3-epimerase
MSSTTPFRDRLAVCTWSLQPRSPADLVDKLKQIAVPRAQIALDPIREDPSTWKNVGQMLRDNGFGIVSGMIGFIGEDYTTIETIHATGGVAPDETWDENWENVPRSADIAAQLGIRLVTFHAGFLPPDQNDPAYTKMHHRLELIADVFAARNIDVAFETGQETSAVLLAFLKHLGRANVGVNFDPANMILYDKGNPLEALRDLAGWLKQMHIKEAIRTRVPGTWGEEVVAGAGEVPWRDFFATLSDLKFTGHCCLEREAGSSRVADLITAKKMVEQLGV